MYCFILSRRTWRIDPVFLNVPFWRFEYGSSQNSRASHVCPRLGGRSSVLFLMIYSGMLEGVGEALFDFVKEIVKFFLG